jgi:hypothetical protein
MKNPRIASGRALQSVALALPDPTWSVLVKPSDAPWLLAPQPVVQPVLAGTQDVIDVPPALIKVLKVLKFSGADIRRIWHYGATIAKLASAAVTIVGAVATIKDVLEYLGVLDDETDELTKLSQGIDVKVRQIYGYLSNSARKQEYEKTLAWRTKVRFVRNSLSNLSASRSAENVQSAKDDYKALKEAIHLMLGLDTARIPFRRDAHAYVPSSGHWIDFADPLYMTTDNGLPVVYRDINQDLAAEVWDPGYYLDVLVDAIAVHLAALKALEPAHVSTGWDRQHLRDLHALLGAFVEQWARSLVYTRVDELVIAGPYPTGYQLLHPYQWNPNAPVETHMIPLGVADPATGLSLFDPGWSEGFQPVVSTDGFGLEKVIAFNAPRDKAVAAAYGYRYQLGKALRTACGIDRMRGMVHEIFQLIAGPAQSEFVDAGDARFTLDETRALPAAENLSLGLVGSYAGKPGKLYPATRHLRRGRKQFSFALARRMDVSEIQLGYRLTLSVGGADGMLEIPLCPYSARSTADQALAPFPPSPTPRELRAQQATVYDVIQSAPFSNQDEDDFERDGKIPGKRRLFLDSRSGKAAIRVEVTLEFPGNPAGQVATHPFLGRAHVTVTNLEPDVNRDGFIVHAIIYETVNAAVDNYKSDAVQERMADDLTLHFAPSVLVVGDEYFDDRERGSKALDEKCDELDKRFRKSKWMLGPREPRERIARLALEDHLLQRTAAELQETRPDEMRAALDRVSIRGR